MCCALHKVRYTHIYAYDQELHQTQTLIYSDVCPYALFLSQLIKFITCKQLSFVFPIQIQPSQQATAICVGKFYTPFFPKLKRIHIYCRQNIVGSPPRGIPRRQIDRQRSVTSRTRRLQRHTSQTGSGRQYDVIPYSCGLLVYISYRMILREFGGGPCPPYIVRGTGLQVGQI